MHYPSLLLVPIVLFLLNTTQNLEARPQIKILTTIFPLMEFARAVSGERGEVSLLVPPGAEIQQQGLIPPIPALTLCRA